MDDHLDLVRNDLENNEQVLVARIYVEADGYGVIVKDEVGDWRGNVFDALGEMVRQPGPQIVETLRRAFDGPYLFVTDPHNDQACPLASGRRSITKHRVKGSFVLPQPG